MLTLTLSLLGQDGLHRGVHTDLGLAPGTGLPVCAHHSSDHTDPMGTETCVPNMNTPNLNDEYTCNRRFCLHRTSFVVVVVEHMFCDPLDTRINW